MKNNIQIKRAVILSLLAVGLGTTAVHAQAPKQGQSEDIEKSDPFNKGAVALEAKAPSDQSAEALDAQARILFARGETDKAIATQEQAVEKAEDDVEKYSATLTRYNGIDSDNTDYIKDKLRTIIIPSIDFNDVSLGEAIEFLRLRSVELDVGELDLNKKGINFIINYPRDGDLVTLRRRSEIGDPFDSNKPESTLPFIPQLRLKNVPLGTVLQYICDATDYSLKIDEYAVTLKPIAAPKPR